jgi:hypothetical protein
MWNDGKDQNCIDEEIKSRLDSGNACYHAVQNLPCCYLKKLKIKIHKTMILIWVLVSNIKGRTQIEDVLYSIGYIVQIRIKIKLTRQRLLYSTKFRLIKVPLMFLEVNHADGRSNGYNLFCVNFVRFVQKMLSSVAVMRFSARTPRVLLFIYP